MTGPGAHPCTNNAQTIDPGCDPKFEIGDAVVMDLCV